METFGHRRSWLAASLAAGLWLVGAVHVHSQYRVLFLGNSFTLGDSDAGERTRSIGGVPMIFDRLARAGGHTNLSVVMRAVGGQDFQFHDQDSTSRAAITSQPWDYVVMHSFSTEPTHFRDGIHSLADFMAYGENLYCRIITNHSQTKVILKETWSRAVGHPYVTGISSGTNFASTEEFQTELRTNYLNLANYLNAKYPTNAPVVLSPVGDAWENAGALKEPAEPGFTRLHATDLWHGNDNGHYLSAAVTYCVIYQESPRGFSTNPVVAELGLKLTVPAAHLEDAAWATVLNRQAAMPSSPSPEPIRFFLEPSSQSVTEFNPAKFKAVALGSPPYFVTWKSNGVPLAGASDFTLVIPSTSAAMDGTEYSVTVSNLVSGATSTNAVLRVIPQPAPTPARAFLFDFGTLNTTSMGPPPDDPLHRWNNVTPAIGLSAGAQMTNLVTTGNQPSGLGLVVLARFANANENGTASFPKWPQNATQDSLYGNTELYGGQSNVFPKFKLTGLDPALKYDFDFYASRMGVSDSRETGYTVAGLITAIAVLEVANNLSNVASVHAITPTPLGEISVTIGPTARNTSSNHFTHLGIMRVTTIPAFLAPEANNGVLTLRWLGEGQLEWSATADGPWRQIQPTPASPYAEALTPGGSRVFRLRVTP